MQGILGYVLVTGVLIVVVALIIRSMWKDHKAGKSCGGCDGDCSHCHSHHEL